MPYLSQHQKMMGIADAFLRDGSLYAPLLEYIEQVMVRESEVSVPEREMIAAHVSRLNGCHFCVGIHNEALSSMGVAKPVLAQLEKGDLTEHSPKLDAALRFAEQLTERPQSVSDDAVQALQNEGWSEQAVEDIVNVVALFSAVNRLVDAFGFVGKATYFKQVGAMLAREGYRPLVKKSRAHKTR